MLVNRGATSGDPSRNAAGGSPQSRGRLRKRYFPRRTYETRFLKHSLMISRPQITSKWRADHHRAKWNCRSCCREPGLRGHKVQVPALKSRRAEATNDHVREEIDQREHLPVGPDALQPPYPNYAAFAKGFRQLCVAPDLVQFPSPICRFPVLNIDQKLRRDRLFHTIFAERRPKFPHQLLIEFDMNSLILSRGRWSDSNWDTLPRSRSGVVARPGTLLALVEGSISWHNRPI